jgi:hypothetical protein
MKKIQILIIAFLISLSICAFAGLQVKAQLSIDVSVSVSQSSIDRGVGTSALTATASGGFIYSYQWMMEAPGQTVFSNNQGATGETYTFAPSSSATIGTYLFEVAVTDMLTQSSALSSPVSVVVSALPTVTVSPIGPITLNVGQVQVFSATASGGSGAIHYQWYLGGSIVSGATGLTYSFSGSIGSYSVTCKVTDSASVPVTSVPSNAASVVVNAVPTVVVSPLSWVMDVGQSKLFSATAGGGSGSYTSYQWYVGGVVQSGASASTFSYSPASAGSYSITVTVTDSSGMTSVQSSVASVTVAVSPTVSIGPVGPILMDVGQVQVFSATGSGGYGSLSYQWYLDGSAVGGTSASYSYTAGGVSHSVTCKVADSVSVPVISGASNAVSVVVSPALVAPTVSSNPGTINQGQASSLSSSAVSTGTSPYTYQWLQRAPGAGSYSLISGATSSSYSFVTSIATATGSWSFLLQVRDNAAVTVTSSAVSVTVNIPPLDHFVFSSVGDQTAGSSFSIIITAKDASNNTLTNFVGTNTLNVSIGTISPTSTGAFSKGVWTGSVIVTGANSGVTLFTTGSGMTGTSNSFTVNSGTLNHFTFSTVNSPQTAGSGFSITVTANDVYDNTVTSYVGTPSLTVSTGSISPSTMNAFVNGVGSTTVTVTGESSGVTITVADSTYSGVSNSFAVTISPTPAPTPTTNPTAPPSSTSEPTPTPTEKPSPSPTPLETTVKAKTDNGATVNLAISGNVTSAQMSSVTLTTSQAANSTTLAMTVIGQSGTTGFSNITIPKTAIIYGTKPVVFIDDQQATNQGYTQDSENFYVWYTTHFSTHLMKIQFAGSLSPQTSSFVPLLVVGIITPEIVLVYTVIAVRRLRRRPENT